MAENCILYYITDRTAFPGDELARQRRLLEKIAEATRAGVDYIQLREKDLTTRDLETLARQAVNVIDELRTGKQEQRTALLINSRSDVAMAAEADGVQLRSDDVSPRDVRAAWKECGAGAPARGLSPLNPLVGISCHSPTEVAQAAENGATFSVFAPIFEKKDGPKTPAGLALLHQATEEKIPVLALGGITLENAPFCLKAGAAGIAAIRLFQENDIASVARKLRGL